jgi:hypothetical protein
MRPSVLVCAVLQGKAEPWSEVTGSGLAATWAPSPSVRLAASAVRPFSSLIPPVITTAVAGRRQAASEFRYYEFLAVDRALSETSSQRCGHCPPGPGAGKLHQRAQLGRLRGDTTKMVEQHTTSISTTQVGAATAFSCVCPPPCSQPRPPPPTHWRKRCAWRPAPQVRTCHSPKRVKSHARFSLRRPHGCHARLP